MLLRCLVATTAFSGVMKWAAQAICAVAGVAVALFAVWAFGVREAGGTDYVTVRGSGNPAEDRWAAQICTAVADWERHLWKTVIRPTNPLDRRVAITGMRQATRRLRADLDRIAPPTDVTRRWQRYVEKAVRENDAKFSKLDPREFNRIEDAAHPLGDVYRLISWDATLASPKLGVMFAEADACDEADRYSLTGTPWP